MCRIFSQHLQDLDSFPKLVSELLKKKFLEQVFIISNM